MTTKFCKCGHELDDHNGPYGDRECTALNCGCEQFVGRASEPSPTEGPAKNYTITSGGYSSSVLDSYPAEPSTEGTQAAQPERREQMTTANYMQRMGFSRCVRCEFTTEGIVDFAEQDKAMMAHLSEKHPNWMTERFKPAEPSTEGTPVCHCVYSPGLNLACPVHYPIPAEPSTEGKPFTEPLEKGWLGTVLKEVRQTADSFEVPAPVAQVDAGPEFQSILDLLRPCIPSGKIELGSEWNDAIVEAYRRGRISVGDECEGCGEIAARLIEDGGSNLLCEPCLKLGDADIAVAQTELPPARYTDAEFEQAKSELSDKGARYERALRYARERELHESITRVTSLTQRLQEKEAQTELPPQESWKASYFWMRDQRDVAEAREAELKAEIERLREWVFTVSSAIKLIPEFFTGAWGGDKEGWGYHLEMVNYCRRKREEAEASAKRHADRMEALERSHKALEKKYRQHLWLSHGHHGYGDDGEMQCSQCLPFGIWDYKNEPLERVEETYKAVKRAAIAAAEKL